MSEREKGRRQWRSGREREERNEECEEEREKTGGRRSGRDRETETGGMGESEGGDRRKDEWEGGGMRNSWKREERGMGGREG